MTRVRAFDPGLWRMHVEAGLRTAHVRRLARENGLSSRPTPAPPSSRRSAATSRRTPAARTPSSTASPALGDRDRGRCAAGRRVAVGGPIRKDVAGYDLRSLLVGSEGTLGVITAVWLRLIPRPRPRFR